MGTYDTRSIVECLRLGVRRTSNLIAQMTEYHGGPVETEYILTADVAREFVETSFYEVAVECLNRRLVNGMTALRGADARKVLRSKRTDIVVLDNQLVTRAIIEIKISVKRLRKIKIDLDKITATMAMMKANFAAGVVGISLFQVYIPGTSERYYKHHFLTEAKVVEGRIAQELAEYAKARPNFTFTMISLQDPDGGIEEREVEDAGGEPAWGREGYAARYHAILIESTRPVEEGPINF